MFSCSELSVFKDSLGWILLAGLKPSYLWSEQTISSLGSLITVINTERNNQPFNPSPFLHKGGGTSHGMVTWTLVTCGKVKTRLRYIPESHRMSHPLRSQLQAPAPFGAQTQNSQIWIKTQQIAYRLRASIPCSETMQKRESKSYPPSPPGNDLSSKI